MKRNPIGEASNSANAASNRLQVACALDIALIGIIPLFLLTFGLFAGPSNPIKLIESAVSGLFVLVLALRSALIVRSASRRAQTLVFGLLALLAICFGIQELTPENRGLRTISVCSCLILAGVILVSSDINGAKRRRLSCIAIYAIGLAQLALFALQSRTLDQNSSGANDRFVGTYMNSGGAIPTYVVGLMLLTFAWNMNRRSIAVACYIAFGAVCFFTDNRAGYLLEALAATGALLYFFIKSVRNAQRKKAIGVALLTLVILATGLLVAFGTNPQGGMMPGVGRVRDLKQVSVALQGLSSPGEGNESSLTSEASTELAMTCGLTKTNQWFRAATTQIEWITNSEFKEVLVGVGESPLTFVPSVSRVSSTAQVCGRDVSSAFLSPNSTVLSILGAFGWFGVTSLFVLLAMSVRRLRRTLSTPQILSVLVPLSVMLLTSTLIESTIILSSILICLVGIRGKPNFDGSLHRTNRYNQVGGESIR